MLRVKDEDCVKSKRGTSNNFLHDRCGKNGKDEIETVVSGGRDTGLREIKRGLVITWRHCQLALSARKKVLKFPSPIVTSVDNVTSDFNCLKAFCTKVGKSKFLIRRINTNQGERGQARNMAYLNTLACRFLFELVLSPDI